MRLFRRVELSSVVAVVVVVVVVVVAACKGPMAKIEAVRDALIADDAATIRDATSAPPKCADGPSVATPSPSKKPGPRDDGCLREIANALGSKTGFVVDPPDHAAATTAAVILLREGRGDYLVHVDMWLSDLKTGKGVGHDVLRMAVARKMAEAAPRIGMRIGDEPTARAAMRAIAGAIPGACPTYWLLGSVDTDPKTIPAELTADNSACVQRDLSRREGPGGIYGEGVFRATEGALAIWRETERALRMGMGNCEPDPKAVLEKKLAIIEPATRKIETQKVETDRRALSFIGDVHAEAGVMLFRTTKDAGASPDASRADSR